MNGEKTVSIKSSSIERVLAGFGIAAAAAGAFVVSRFNPATAGFFPVCPLYQLTGLSCPGCGLTRGFHALFGGDILGALHFNALLPVYFFVFAYLLASMFSVAVRGRGISLNIFRPNWIWSFLIIALVFGVARNFPAYPFTLLVP
ncbi:MAG TPA: DUF2752 domain-containing protein [Pyrinomonadaceae bacterium]|nr:DUF2752 domain-containing protein [Pyrinomonadaceae bacterium]